MSRCRRGPRRVAWWTAGRSPRGERSDPGNGGPRLDLIPRMFCRRRGGPTGQAPRGRGRRGLESADVGAAEDV